MLLGFNSFYAKNSDRVDFHQHVCIVGIHNPVAVGKKENENPIKAITLLCDITPEGVLAKSRVQI